VRKFLVTLVVLAALLVAADFGARVYAESQTAAAVQAQLGTATAPDVSIEGFPFLYHAVRGEYPQVIITALIRRACSAGRMRAPEIGSAPAAARNRPARASWRQVILSAHWLK